MGGEVLELESEKLIRKGRQQGIQQGMQQGIQTNTAETVIRMRNTGKFTEEDISLATGLGLEAIRKIKQADNVLDNSPGETDLRDY